MPSRRTVLLLIPHLGGGGAERVTELLSHHLPNEKYRIHLGLATSECAGSVALPDSVAVHPLGAKRVRFAALRVLRLIWRVRPDVILCGMAHLNLLVLLLRPLLPRDTRILVRQNGTLSTTLRGFGGAVLRLVFRVLYCCADGVICQSSAMARDLHKSAGIPLEALAILPNPVDVDAVRSAESVHGPTGVEDGPHLLAIGRLAREKGFDLLLDAFSEVRRRFPSADLTIAGSGSQETALRAQAYVLGLEKCVRISGYVQATGPLLRNASLFVVSSREEGMPNAALEAAASGLPIVALPSAGGWTEEFGGQPGIWLAREVSSEALATTISEALSKLHPSQRFAHSWIDLYSLENAIPAYEWLIDFTLAGQWV